MGGSSVIHALLSLPSQAWWLIAILAGLSLLGSGGQKRKKKKKKKDDDSGMFGVVIVAGALLLAAGAGGGALKVPAVHHAVTRVFHSSGPANEQLADKMAAARGWGSDQQGCLNRLWDRETGSTWDTHITDPITVNGHLAFGIAQAVGHDPNGSAAVFTYEKFLSGSVRNATVDDYPTRAANAGSARAQIAWGLGYIGSAYGNPCAAWNYEVANNGY